MPTAQLKVTLQDGSSFNGEWLIDSSESKHALESALNRILPPDSWPSIYRPRTITIEIIYPERRKADRRKPPLPG